MKSFSARWTWLLGVVAIYVATVAAYGPALHGGFIWNDSDYVTAPHLRSLHGLWRIWFEVGATQQYYPLLHSAFWVEHRLWGDATLGYHLVNVLLHATGACLLVAVLMRLWGAEKKGAAWLGGFLFALHPVCVESVAWISEQKNTLSIVFYLLSGWMYLKFDERRPRNEIPRDSATVVSNDGGSDFADDRSGNLQVFDVCRYGLATLFFILAILSKSVTCTLPAALLVVVWWKRGRIEWKRDVLPLVPWLAAAAVYGLFSAWVEKTYIGAEGSAFELSLLQRTLLAGRIIWFYLGKLVWPVHLIFIYPRWKINAGQPWQYVFLAAAVALAVVLWAMRRRTRGPLAAYLFFVGSLFPTLGFFNVYAFIFSFVADHWQYLPCIGILAAGAAGWRAVVPGKWFAASAAAVLGLLGVLTWRQSRMYTDIQTFYETTLARNPDCWMAHNNLGNLLRGKGRPDLAIAHFRRALKIKADIAESHNNLAVALRETGHLPEAVGEYREAVRIKPKFADAWANLGVALGEAGKPDEAMKAFQTSLKLWDNDANTHNGYGIVLAQVGRPKEAEAQIKRAMELDPSLYSAYSNLGNVYCMENRLEDGVRMYKECLAHEPGNVDVRDDLAMTLGQLNRFEEARVQLEEALKHDPKSAQSHFDLYMVLMSLGRPDEAFGHFHEARRLNPNVGSN